MGHLVSTDRGDWVPDWIKKFNDHHCSTFHFVVSALKEAKGTSVPVAQYTAEGLPTINLDYKEVSDSEIIQNGSVRRLSWGDISVTTMSMDIIFTMTALSSLMLGQRSTSLWHWKCTMKLPLSFAWLASSSSRKPRSQPRRSFTGESFGISD